MHPEKKKYAKHVNMHPKNKTKTCKTCAHAVKNSHEQFLIKRLSFSWIKKSTSK